MSTKTEMDLKRNPVTYNELYQIQSGYPGLDMLESAQIKKGELFAIVELPNPNGGGDYFMPLKELNKYGLDAQALCNVYQVGPFFDKNKKPKPKIATYKPIVRLYMANEDLSVAKGNTYANPQYGRGGAVQMVRPFGRDEIKKADLDVDFKSQHPILPIDLNNEEFINKIPDKSKKELYEIMHKYKGSINKDGTFDLKNTEIDSKVYKIIDLKKQLHENVNTQISLLYEYNKELNNPNKNIKYIKKLKDDLRKLENYNENNKDDLIDSIEVVKENPSLTKSMVEADKEHLLNPANYCLDENKQMLTYAKEKMNYLEANLSKEEREKIGISKNIDEVSNFKINKDLENKMDSLYSYINFIQL